MSSRRGARRTLTPTLSQGERGPDGPQASGSRLRARSREECASRLPPRGGARPRRRRPRALRGRGRRAGAAAPPR
ncbi:MAG: hypothetical protein F4X26_06360 [Chloroflexi bacterium]|nr:hypothetical protein [Chloroflexota bacterium]